MRELPNNRDAEQAVLCAALVNRHALTEVSHWLAPEMFYSDRHARIYRLMLDIDKRGDAPTLPLVAMEMRRAGADTSETAYLIELVNLEIISTQVETFARKVEDAAISRQLIRAAGAIAEIAYDDARETEQKIGDASQALIGIQATGTRHGLKALVALAENEHIRVASNNPGGIPTGFKDLDRYTGGLHNSDLMILAGRPAMGKCLTAGTLIDIPGTGERMTIQECVQRQVPTVYGVSDTGEIRATVISHWIDSGIKPCYRVRTRLGREVEVTGHHPFLTIQGWKPLHDLSVGGYIAVPTKVECFGVDESLPSDLVRLLAYFIAEGGLTHTSPVFTNTDPILINDFKQIIAQHFPSCAIRQHGIDYTVAQSRTGTTPRRAIFPKNSVTMWLKDLGLMGKLAQEKFFPACVWKWSKPRLAEFIRVLMSCDGCIYSLKGHPVIEFTVASQQLAIDLHHAFVRFGIVSKLCQKTARAWRVEVTSPESIKRYQDEIGWLGEKSSRFQGHTHSITARGGNFGHAPNGVWNLIRAGIQRRSISMIELARRSGETSKTGHGTGYNPHMRRSLPRYRLARYAEILDDNNLRRASSPDVYWDEITSIEPIGDLQVYDLTVPDGANFIAQDIFVHNTSFVLNLAYEVASINSRDVLLFELEMSEEQLTQRSGAMYSGIELSRIRHLLMNAVESAEYLDTLDTLAQLPVFVDDTPAVSLTYIRNETYRHMAQREKPAAIIVDYLQLMGGGAKRAENRVQEVSEISRGLKQLAREIDCPVIALSQLSRAVESRPSKIPLLSDLRESGGLEQDADIVVFLYREEYYDPNTQDKRGVAELHIAKHRQGPIGVVPLRFDKTTTRFSDLSYRTAEGD